MKTSFSYFNFHIVFHFINKSLFILSAIEEQLGYFAT